MCPLLICDGSGGGGEVGELHFGVLPAEDHALRAGLERGGGGGEDVVGGGLLSSGEVGMSISMPG